jgi:hypothetical protein
MARPKAVPADVDDAPLRRLGGGRWQTRDARFTVEPQSGTWVIVDAEQTDDLGLPLVRGPFRSLTAAKAAIGAARTTPALSSPLAGRLGRDRSGPTVAEDIGAASAPSRRSPGPDGRRDSKPGERPRLISGAATPAVRETVAPSAPARGPGPLGPPEEPSWIADLGAMDRGRARRLIARLRDDGLSDAEGIVRRDLLGGVPAIAAHAITARLAGLAAPTTTDDVVALLAEGRDETLGVRWRIVDGDGRPIVLDRRR